MSLHISLFTILLMALLLKSGYGSTSESCFAKSREEDEVCGRYCYKIVKPLLKNYATVQSKEDQFEDLKNKINDQEKNIKQNEYEIQQLKSNVNARDKEMKDKDDQLSLRDKQIESKDKQLALKDKQIESKDKQLALKDKEIEIKDKQLDLNSAKIKYLESKFSEFQLSSISSNCLGKSTDVYMLNLPNIGPFSVSCDSRLAGAGWTVFQRRVDGSVDFYRNWNEYKEGFGDLRGEFHLGLEKLHLLTQFQPHELYIHLEDFEGNTRYARYSHFVVGSEAEWYELKKIGEYSGNAGDSLKYHLNIKFTTKDRDNGLYSQSCAQIYEAAGWYTSCFSSSLNGKYTRIAGKGVKKIAWNHWSDNPIKFVQQMIRPIFH